ncbi:MAG: class I SAM-dependent methyltransferase [Candidatus Odinarchaeota archaeon]
MAKKFYKSTIESTMVGPLYARAKYSALYPETLKDPLAETLLKQIIEMYPDQQEKFAMLEEFMDEFTSINFLFRAKKFDDEIREFIKIHPFATIINLGCGLDTSNLRIGDINLKWFQIDLPDGISLREQLIPPTLNSKDIAKSILDYRWFEEVDFNKESGVLILAAGLLNYFEEVQLKDLCDNLANYFKGGILLFDLPSVLLKKIINRKYKNLGFQGTDLIFGLGNPKKILKWSNKIKTMSCTIFYKDLDLNPKWTIRTRFLLKLFRTLKFYKFVKLEFKS